MEQLSEYEVWLRDEYRPIRGGQGGEGEEGDHGGDGGDEGGEGKIDPATGNFIPKQRFDQVYGKMKDYENKYKSWAELGDPAEVKATLAEHRKWKEMVEEQRKKASLSPDEKTEAEENLRIEKELLRRAPWLANARKVEQLEAKLAELEGSISGSRLESVATKASSELSGMMSSAKIDAKYQERIENFIFSQMTPEEQRQFAQGDFSRMKEIFDQELNEGLLSTFKRGPKLPEPPVRFRPGGTPQKTKEAKPKTLDEATNDAWAKLNEG